jgi:transposase
MSKIAKQMNISRHTVSLWLKIYNNNKNLKRKKGSRIYYNHKIK